MRACATSPSCRAYRLRKGIPMPIACAARATRRDPSSGRSTGPARLRALPKSRSFCADRPWHSAQASPMSAPMPCTFARKISPMMSSRVLQRPLPLRPTSLRPGSRRLPAPPTTVGAARSSRLPMGLRHLRGPTRPSSATRRRASNTRRPPRRFRRPHPARRLPSSPTPWCTGPKPSRRTI